MYGSNCIEEDLYQAVKKQNIDTIKLLLENNKLDINYLHKDKDGEKTALYLAVEKGNIEIVKLLLTNDKIDINIINKAKVCEIDLAKLWWKIKQEYISFVKSEHHKLLTLDKSERSILFWHKAGEAQKEMKASIEAILAKRAELIECEANDGISEKIKIHRRDIECLMNEFFDVVIKTSEAYATELNSKIEKGARRVEMAILDFVEKYSSVNITVLNLASNNADIKKLLSEYSDKKEKEQTLNQFSNDDIFKLLFKRYQNGELSPEDFQSLTAIFGKK